MDLHRLDALARARGGIVTRHELLELGCSPSAVDRSVRRGQLLTVAAGVFRVAGSPWSRRSAQHAALLVAGPDAHLARWSAAEVLDFSDLRTERRTGPIEVVLPGDGRGRAAHGALVRVRRTRCLPAEDRTVVAGLPVVAAPRTLLDLAAETDTHRLTELAAAALRLRLTDLDGLREVLERRPAARGRQRLSRALRHLDLDGGSTRSDVEVAALRELVAAGLPRPEVAFRVRDERGLVIAEVDLAYPATRLAIEVDGYRWHSSPAAKRADEQRQNRLVLAGWTVLRFAATDVRHHPERIVAAVRRALASCARGDVTDNIDQA